MMDGFERTKWDGDSPVNSAEALISISSTALGDFSVESDTASMTAQWSKDEDTISSASQEDESGRISSIVNFRLPTISPFAVHHCTHVIFLRAQRASCTNPARALELAAKSRQVGQLAESVLKTLSKMPKLCIADGENIPKQLHRLVLERIYEELLSKTGIPFDLMKAFNTGDVRLEHAFTLSFLKAIQDEDLESCLFYPPDSDSLCDGRESDTADADSVRNCISMAILLLLKLLANVPLHTLHTHVSSQELMNRVLTLCMEALSESEADQIDELYQRVFVDLCGQFSFECLIDMPYAPEDWGIDDDITISLDKEELLFKSDDTEFTSTMPDSACAVFSKLKKKKTWLRSVSKIFRKKSKVFNKAVSGFRDQEIEKSTEKEKNGGTFSIKGAHHFLREYSSGFTRSTLLPRMFAADPSFGAIVSSTLLGSVGSVQDTLELHQRRRPRRTGKIFRRILLKIQ